MKKSILAITLLFLGLLSANAQLGFGLKGGVHFSSIALDGYSTRTAAHVGAFVQLKAKKIAVQPEVLYSYQGAGDIQLAYISVPIMGQYYIVKGLNVEVGPQISFLTYAHHNGVVGGSGDMKGFMNKTDIGINFGAAYKLPVTPLGLYARYSLGVNELFNNGPWGLDGGRNNLFQLGVFLKF